MTAALAQAGGAAGSLGLVALMLGTRRPVRVAGCAGWALGAALLAVYLAPHGHRGALAGAAVVALLLVALAAAVLVRWPWALPFATLALVPARIPVSLAGSSANLLLPLYGVVGAAALALFWQLAGEERRARELGPIAWPLALWVGWTGVSITWTGDLHEGAIELLFFVLPFGLLAVALARLPWSRRGLTGLYGLLALMGVLFAAIGLYQWATRDVFWNPKVIVPNAYAPFFRVNSVFYDPSIYGRFLVVAILASLVVVLFGVAPRVAVAVTAVIAVTWWGLLYSYSQSSFAALIAGTLIAAALVWGWRAVIAVVLTAAVAVAIGFSAPRVRHVIVRHTSKGWNSATSGRASLIANGIQIALHHPAVGVGVGGFKRAYADRTGLKGKEPKAAASHNTPVTVAAETGFPGLLLLLWLVAEALLATFRRVRNTFAGRAAAAFGIMIAAITVHSLAYDDLFEDPTFWALLGLAALAWYVRPEERAPVVEAETAAATRAREPAAGAAGAVEREGGA